MKKKVIFLILYIFIINIEVIGDDYVKNAKDKVRFSQIISKTMQSDTYLTKNIHFEFWSILNSHSNISDYELKKLRLLTTGSVIDYMVYFYEDMLQSMDQKRIFKSAKREKIEKFLLDEKILYNWRITQNDEYIEKAIKGQAVKTKNGDVYFTEELIYDALKNLETLNKRISILFTKPSEKLKFKNNVSSTINLVNLANELNKNLPIMIDKDTKLYSSIGINKNFKYMYQFVNYTKDEINLDNIKENIIVGACNLPDFKIYFQNDIEISYSYVDKNNIYIGEITTNKTKCLVRKYIGDNNLKEYKKVLFSLNDKEFLKLDIDYRKLPKSLADIYIDRLGNVEIY